MRWYYAMARQTARDSFVLPPSGALYAYPGRFPRALQTQYAAMTNEAARVLDTHGSADWELIFGWEETLKNYLPLYQKGSAKAGVKMFFVQQVPYALPISPGVMPKSSTVLGDPSSPDSVALVQPPLAVASSGTWDRAQAPDEIARQINALKRGEVTYIYCITGNSAPQAALLNMSAHLADYVQLVGYQQLASLAKQRLVHENQLLGETREKKITLRNGVQ
eukprot:COSAG01_NODE_3342_length_6229_cov_4.142088_4_plen_221_part_00